MSCIVAICNCRKELHVSKVSVSSHVFYFFYFLFLFVFGCCVVQGACGCFYCRAPFSPRSNTGHDRLPPRRKHHYGQFNHKHIHFQADCSTARTPERRPPVLNKVKPETQWLPQLLPSTYLPHCAVTVGFWAPLWHSPSHRARESNNCWDIPNGLIPFNLSLFVLLPDPDHILPHCGEGNILQWVKSSQP